MSNDIVAALKGLSLHGMASAWPEVLGTARIKTLDHETVLHQLLKAEAAQREVRSMAYQMRVARFQSHRDLAGFDFTQAGVDEGLIRDLHQMKFLESAHNVVFIGGPGTGKTLWRPVWVSRRSAGTASGCASSPPWSWSMRWSWKRRRANQVNWRTG